MCQYCFDTEIKSFSSRQEFEQFDLALTKKLGNSSFLIKREFVVTQWKDIGYYVYECLNCKTLWALSNPDYEQKHHGYLKKQLKDKYITTFMVLGATSNSLLF